MRVGSLVECIQSVPYNPNFVTTPREPQKGDLAIVTKVNSGGHSILLEEFHCVSTQPYRIEFIGWIVEGYWKEVQPPMEVSNIVQDAIENYSPVETTEYQ